MSPPLIELVNKVNTKLLYSELMNGQNKEDIPDYNLLNAFELLWNLDKQQLPSQLEACLDTEQLNLVEILGHNLGNPADIKNALSFKQECVEGLVSICQKLRPYFLEQPFLIETGDLVHVPDESLLIRSIDSNNVNSWADFEYVLSLVLENRILKLYVAHLARLSNQVALQLEDEVMKITPKKKRKKKKRKAVKSTLTDTEELNASPCKSELTPLKLAFSPCQTESST